MQLAYNAKACKDADVALESRSIGKGTGTSFGFNHHWSVASGSGKAASIAASRACNATNLSGPAAASARALQLQVADWDWVVVPRSPRDCSVVNLVAASGPHKGKYLRVPNTCDRFEWGDGNSGRAQFKLTKASELGR